MIGVFGLGYGLLIMARGQAQVYRGGEVRQYRGKAALAVGAGTTLAGFGLVLIGLYGFTMVPLGLAGAVAYFVLSRLADRM